MMMDASKPKRHFVSGFFYFLFCVNVLMYMEAGAVPAMLIPLATSFSMSLSEQGLLGGVVFLSIACAGPFAGSLLRSYDHRYVLGFSLVIFTLLTFFWAMIPTYWAVSTSLFISVRFVMGLCQCVCCVFFPLWTNEFAPRMKTASWMSVLQASVPFGVMTGYIIASIILKFSNDSNTCYGVYCWRLPIIAEGVALVPFSFIIFFAPKRLVNVSVKHKSINQTTYSSGGSDTSTLVANDDNSLNRNGGVYGSLATIDTSQRIASPSGTRTKPRCSSADHIRSVTMTPTRMKRLKAWQLDQKKSYRRLRQSSMAASLFDPMSARDALRHSNTSLAAMDSQDDLMGMISTGGLTWVDTNSPLDQFNDEYDDTLELIDIEEDCKSDASHFLNGNNVPLRDNNSYTRKLEKWENKIKDLVNADSRMPDGNDTLDERQGMPCRSWSMPPIETDSNIESAGSSRPQFIAPPILTRSNSFDSESESVADDACRDNGKPLTIYNVLVILMKIPVYRYVVLAMAALYFVVTGIQFWGTSYMIIVLNTPVLLVQGFFIFVAATGPTSGVMFGGWYIDQEGGYKGIRQRYKAIKICCVFGTIGVFWALLTVITSNFYLVVLYIWLVLFFGGATLPACSGIVVSIVPRRYRPYSSSISLVIFNIFGYFLSVVLSGTLMQTLASFDPSCNEVCCRKFGFRIVLLWSCWSMLFLVFALRAASFSVKSRYSSLRFDE